VTHLRAIHYARMHQTVVVRWHTDFKDWEQQPHEAFQSDAMLDPCFYEYFVLNTPGFITSNLNKDLHTVNGRSMICHSVKVHSAHQKWFEDQLQSALPGSVITLPVPPLAVNVVWSTKEIESQETLHALKTELSVPVEAAPIDTVVVSLTKHAGEWLDCHTCQGQLNPCLWTFSSKASFFVSLSTSLCYHCSQVRRSHYGKSYCSNVLVPN
jgi:hypothetical protein